MSIEVTARHELNPRIHDYAREKADRIMRDFPKVEHTSVVLGNENKIYRAEIVVRAKGGQVVGSADHESNIVVSIDEACEKVVKQLRKQRDKEVDTRHAG